VSGEHVSNKIYFVHSIQREQGLKTRQRAVERTEGSREDRGLLGIEEQRVRERIEGRRG
jgi:hypothetical protein